MAESPFLDPSEFPELEALRTQWRVMLEEALATRAARVFVNDARVQPNTWSIVPFGVEDDDRSVVADELCRTNRLLAPLTVALIDGIPEVLAS